jgi:hypothetical protein
MGTMLIIIFSLTKIKRPKFMDAKSTVVFFPDKVRENFHQANESLHVKPL